jgi:aryl-alcohol dehydrogenase-like predicted oxidoreductase
MGSMIFSARPIEEVHRLYDRFVEAGGNAFDTARVYGRGETERSFVASSPNLALPVPNEPMWLNCVSLSGDAEAQAWYRRTGMPIFAWSSQARGFFGDRFAPERPEVDRDVTRVYYAEGNWERRRRAGELAREKGVTPTQIALAWVLSQPLEVFALVGPLSIAELEDCLGALEVELTPEDVGWLNLEGERVPAGAR